MEVSSAKNAKRKTVTTDRAEPSIAVQKMRKGIGWVLNVAGKNRRYFLAVLVSVGLTLGSVWAVNRLGGIDDQILQASVEENWNRTLSSLGVSPIFPPEEDLVVGDILAVVTSDSDEDPAAQTDRELKRAFVSRSVKLAHVDVSKQLEETYGSLPVFPVAVPADGKHPYRRVVAREFTDAVAIDNLPRAAFPRLKIQGYNAAAANLTASSNRSNYSAGSQNFEEFELSDVRTYGLTSVMALEILKKVCENSEDLCIESTARRHLERVVGSRINSRYINLKSNKPEYAMNVEVVMVYRVYLTNSIIDRRRRESDKSGMFAGLWSLSGTGQQKVVTPPQEPPAQSVSETDNIDASKAIGRRIDDLEHKVALIQSGAAIRYQSFSGNESSLEGKFERPVAIAYRSVRTEFPSGKVME
jgi:hypothetical protein